MPTAKVVNIIEIPERTHNGSVFSQINVLKAPNKWDGSRANSVRGQIGER